MAAPPCPQRHCVKRGSGQARRQLWPGGRGPCPQLVPSWMAPVPARMNLLEKQGGEEVPAPPAVTTRTEVPESRGTATHRGWGQCGECWPWGSPAPARPWGSASHRARGQGQSQQSDSSYSRQRSRRWDTCATSMGALAPAEQGVHQEIAQRGACDGPQEDPGVVGHDSQHHHVAQHHLQHMEQRLGHVEPEPPGEKGGKCHHRGAGAAGIAPYQDPEGLWGTGKGVGAANSSSGANHAPKSMRLAVRAASGIIWD